MKSYSEREVFSPWELWCLHQAQRLVAAVPDEPEEGQLRVRCHELARAVAHILGISPEFVQDGKYGRTAHTWIWLCSVKDERRHVSILDVYTPGVVPQVLLLDVFMSLPHDIYHGQAPRGDIDGDMVKSLLQIFGKVELEPQP